jgi:glutathione S-transferase
MTHVLYFAPGACSLGPNIALREAGIAFELTRDDLRQKKLATGEDYLAINPNGYVPALRLEDGSVLTEAAVMLQYIADQAPGKGLAPPPGSRQRYRLQEWLNFVATELHKGTSPLYNATANDEFKTSLKTRLAARWQHLANAVKDRDFVMGELTVVDPYAFYVLRSWQHAHKESLERWPALVSYYKRLAARPAFVAALASEGLEA